MITFVQVILAIFILIGGFIKLFRIPFQVEHWRHYRYPLWFMSAIGLIELIGAIGMIGGIWNQHLVLGSGILFIILMIGAIHTHMFRAHQPIVTVIPATICLILSIVVIFWNSDVFS
ncbi:DoxX family protein [Priestia megaterium]|jgi:DoxX-like family|uniref:DoxX family protein n=1 Tax=Priestia megaterium TaxID=1404 RepID=UPI0023DAD1E2|nr:DoxX family protein [Priestia megaterium]MDF2014241.1 DoxX family protein [Priestia megaterium]